MDENNGAKETIVVKTKNETKKMLQKTFYDTMRFRSEQEAEASNEIYKAEYTAGEIRITDPDGLLKVIKLSHEPRAGLDVSDHANLEDYMNTDMEKRDNDSKK